MKRRNKLAKSILFLAILALNANAEVASISADLIIVNADIRTSNPAQMHAEAFAVKEGKFFAIGSSLEIEKLKDKDTKVLDVEGKTILPGFIDSHTHLSSGAKIVTGIDLTGIANKSVWLEMIAERVKTMAVSYTHLTLPTIYSV